MVIIKQIILLSTISVLLLHNCSNENIAMEKVTYEYEKVEITEEQKNVADSVVLIHRYNNTGKMLKHVGVGAGVIISDDLIITACHVLENSNYYGVAYNNDSDTHHTKAKVLYQNEQMDIALLSNPKKEGVPALLGDSDKLIVDNDIIVIGSPEGSMNEIIYGKFLKIVQRDGINSIKFNAEIKPGHSGGAIFNMDKKLVGIVISRRIDTKTISYAVPINEVKEIILQFTNKALSAQ